MLNITIILIYGSKEFDRVKFTRQQYQLLQGIGLPAAPNLYLIPICGTPFWGFQPVRSAPPFTARVTLKHDRDRTSK